MNKRLHDRTVSFSFSLDKSLFLHLRYLFKRPVAPKTATCYVKRRNTLYSGFKGSHKHHIERITSASPDQHHVLTGAAILSAQLCVDHKVGLKIHWNEPCFYALLFLTGNVSRFVGIWNFPFPQVIIGVAAAAQSRTERNIDIRI